MRVHELAKELGWPPARLVDELRRRGEWVKSAMSIIEAPVVRFEEMHIMGHERTVEKPATRSILTRALNWPSLCGNSVTR